jgi:hypothetical protein
MILKIDTDILHACDINQRIQFQYDGIDFPYIVVWYSTVQHKNFYQLFYDAESAKLFRNTLENKGKTTALFAWNFDDMAYNSTAVI